MTKKIITACVPLAAFAVFAMAPALASASPVLTDTEPPGTSRTVGAGKKLIATNTGNTKLTTSLGTIECTTSVTTGTTIKNSGTEIEVQIETASFTGTGAEERCTTAFLGNIKVTPKKLPWCTKATSKMIADTWELKSGACGGALGAMEFTLDSSTIGECTYTKAAVTGTFTTGSGGDATLSEQQFTKSAGSGFCPGSGNLDLTEDWYTDLEGPGGVPLEGPSVFVS